MPLLALILLRPDGARGNDSVRPPAEIEEFLPDVLRRRFEPDLAPDENAREKLLAMLSLVRTPSDREQARLLSDYSVATREFPPAQQRGWLTNVLHLNRPAIEQLQGVVEHSHVRLTPEDDALSLRTKILAFHEILRVQARLSVEDGDFRSVVEQVRDEMRFGHLLTAPPADYRLVPVGLRIQDASVALLEEAARDRDVPAEVLQDFIKLALSAGGHPDALEFTTRSQFDGLVKPQLQRLLPNEDVDVVVGLWLDRMRPEKPLPFENFDIDAELRSRGQQIEAILADHPHPYDREQTIRLVVDRFASALQQPSRWDPALMTADKIDACWPRQLSLHVLDLVSLPLGNEQPVLEPAELAAARECLRPLDNPLGRHLATEMTALEMTISHASLTSSIRLRTASLAVRLFHDSRGRLPDSLEEVVVAGILPAVPRDPFGDVIHYSADRKIVWSVWTNGVDDNGEFEPGDSFALLRKLRPRGTRELPPPPPPPAKSPPDDRVRKIPLADAGGSD